jgi:hypothetical protein
VRLHDLEPGYYEIETVAHAPHEIDGVGTAVLSFISIPQVPAPPCECEMHCLALVPHPLRIRSLLPLPSASLGRCCDGRWLRCVQPVVATIRRLGPLNEWRVPPPPLPGGGGAARKHALPPHAFEFLSPDGGEGLRGKVPSARTHAHICAPTLTYACTHSRVHAPKHAHAPYLSCYSHARAQAH